VQFVFAGLFDLRSQASIGVGVLPERLRDSVKGAKAGTRLHERQARPSRQVPLAASATRGSVLSASAGWRPPEGSRR